MTINLRQLEQQLNHQHTVIVLAGSDTALIDDAVHQVRSHANFSEFSLGEQHVMTEKDDIAPIQTTLNQNSLFETHSMLLVDAQSTGLRKPLAEVLTQYAAQKSHHRCVIVKTSQLTKQDQQRVWFKQLDQHALVVQLWPLKPTEYTQWIAHHAKRLGLCGNPELYQLIQSNHEGSPAAARQSLEKLKLSFANNPISTSDARTYLFNQSTYLPRELMAFCLSGQREGTLKALSAFKGDSSAIHLLLWLLARDLQCLQQLSSHPQPTDVFKQYQIWPNQQAPFQAILRQTNDKLIEHWLTCTAALDQCLKSENQWLAWPYMTTLIMSICTRQRMPLANPMPTLDWIES